MEHVGIDLGASGSAICVVSSEGVVLNERMIRTSEIERFLSKRPASRVAIESCAESRLVAIQTREQGHDVRVVPTVFVRSLGIGTRRIKTDKRDAKNLAIASFRLGDELPHIHVRSDEAAAIQDLVRARSSLVSHRTMAINFVRAQLRKALLGRGPRRTAKTFCDAVRKLVGEDTSLEVNAHLVTIDVLNEQIEGLEKRMKAIAEASERATRLRKITGVGPIVSLAFLAAIADPKRFASGSHLASYIGLSPGENTTGGKVRRTGIIAAGQRQLRGLLFGAGSSANGREHAVSDRQSREASWRHPALARNVSGNANRCHVCRAVDLDPRDYAGAAFIAGKGMLGEHGSAGRNDERWLPAPLQIVVRRPQLALLATTDLSPSGDAVAVPIHSHV